MNNDIHKEKAAELFNIPLDMVTSKQREYAKMYHYHLAYCDRPMSFAEYFKQEHIKIK